MSDVLTTFKCGDRVRIMQTTPMVERGLANKMGSVSVVSDRRGTEYRMPMGRIYVLRMDDGRRVVLEGAHLMLAPKDKARRATGDAQAAKEAGK